jgi:hypothetical protein
MVGGVAVWHAQHTPRFLNSRQRFTMGVAIHSFIPAVCMRANMHCQAQSTAVVVNKSTRASAQLLFIVML